MISEQKQEYLEEIRIKNISAEAASGKVSFQSAIKEILTIYDDRAKRKNIDDYKIVKDFIIYVITTTSNPDTFKEAASCFLDFVKHTEVGQDMLAKNDGVIMLPRNPNFQNIELLIR